MGLSVNELNLGGITTAQRDAIVLPANSLLIYNTTSGHLEVNRGTPTNPYWVGTHEGVEAPPLNDLQDAYTLDGANEYLNLGDIVTSIISGAGAKFSIRMRIRKALDGVTQGLFSTSKTSGDRQFEIQFRSWNDLTVNFYSTPTTGAYWFQSAPTNDFFMVADGWIDLIVTFDETLAPSKNACKAIRDGVAIPVNPSVGDTTTIHTAANDAIVGTSWRDDAGAYGFSGDISYIAIYDAIITTAEAATAHNSGTPLQLPVDNLQAYYDGSADTWSVNKHLVVDGTGINPDGESVNMEENDLTHL